MTATAVRTSKTQERVARPTRRRTSGPDRETRVKLVLYVTGGVLASLVFLVPLLFSFTRSLQTNAVITAAPGAGFFDWSFANFGRLFASGNLALPVLNSLVVSIATAVLTAVIATLAGYGFARFDFPFGSVAFGVILLTMMVPFQAVLTPLYLELNTLGLTDNLLGLILFSTTVNLPFGVFVMRNAFETVPSELEEAALVDGAGTIRMLVSVLRPLVVPGIATTALYAFLASWTEFLGALTFLTNARLFTLPVALVNLQQGTYGTVDFGLIAAGSIIAAIPCVLLYVALQRYYVSGLASGSVKG